jgi:two-component system, cell cycle sensor histidine kinase and response regulator CckA
MADEPITFPPVDAELLVATFVAPRQTTYRNDVWTATLGEEALPWTRLESDDQHQAEQCVAEAASGSLVLNQVFPVELPDRDEPVPVLLSFLPVIVPDSDGRPDVRAVTVSGEVLAEPHSWTLRQTRRHRMETLGRMTMGIAHDFNNLLSGILGYTELMKSLLPGDEAEAPFRDHLRTIEQAALDGASLVRKIQQYIRQEKQKRFESVDLPTLMRDCATLTRPYWYNEPRRQGIAIDAEMDLEDVPPVNGSAPELREVFINMILNAVQAMPNGGKLSLGCRYMPDRGVVVTVSDTGVGMSESVRDRIFEPLFTTKGEHGSGMGLAVSYGILQEHEATVSVDSRPLQGARFELVFPPADEAAQEPLVEAIPSPGASARVLIVDDERMVRSVLTKLLHLKGHTVCQASSGAEALAIAATEPLDIVFTDLGMPEMNGRQLAVALRERNPALPIVLLTGDTNTGTPDAFIDAVIAKPFRLDELEAAIRRFVPE